MRELEAKFTETMLQQVGRNGEIEKHAVYTEPSYVIHTDPSDDRVQNNTNHRGQGPDLRLGQKHVHDTATQMTT